MALEDFNEAIRLDPLFPLARVNRALAYIDLSRDEEAMMDIDKAVELGLDRRLLDEMVEKAKQERSR